MDWLDLLAVQGTLKSLLQHHSSKASILRHSSFFMVQLSHPYMTPGKTIALTRRTFVGKVISLLFNMLSRLVTGFLPRSKCLLISWLQAPSAVILEPKKIKSVTISIVSPCIWQTGKLEVVKQDITRVNIDILGISEWKWTGIGKLNADDYYIYYWGKESPRRNGVALIVKKRVQNSVLVCNLKSDRIISVHFQGKPFNITVIYVPTTNAEEDSWTILWRTTRPPWTNTKKKIFFSLQGIGMQK